jgi:hypothetical protein
LSIFDEYQDLIRPEFVEGYSLETCPTARDPEGAILSLDVAVALLKSDGHIAAVAQALGRSRRVIDTFIQRDLNLSELLEDIQETFLDDAEAKAKALARSGDGGVLKYMLSTIGKRRGYVTRTETVLPNGGMTVQFFLPTNGRETHEVIDGTFSSIPESGQPASAGTDESGERDHPHRGLDADTVGLETQSVGLVGQMGDRAFGDRQGVR